MSRIEMPVVGCAIGELSPVAAAPGVLPAAIAKVSSERRAVEPTAKAAPAHALRRRTLASSTSLALLAGLLGAGIAVHNAKTRGVERSLTPPSDEQTKFALLLIDVQNDFWGPAYAEVHPEFEARTARLIELCRQEQIEIIHVRSQWAEDRSNWPTSFKLRQPTMPCRPGSHGAAVPAFAEEAGAERVFYKSGFDGLMNEDLVAYLTATNKRHLFLAGLYTDVCVLSTALSAVNRGYLVSVVADCCASEPSAHAFVLEKYSRVVFDRTTHDQIPNLVKESSLALAAHGL